MSKQKRLEVASRAYRRVVERERDRVRRAQRQAKNTLRAAAA